MTDERDDEQAPYTQHPLDTKTAEVIAAIVTLACVAGAGAIVVASLLRMWPW